MPHNHRIRLDVFANSTELPAWQFEILADFAKSEFVELDGLILQQGTPKPQRWPLLFQLFQRIDGRLPHSVPDACEMKNIETLFHGKSHTPLQDIAQFGRESHNDQFGKSRHQNAPDFILALCNTVDPRLLASRSRSGTICFHHDGFDEKSGAGLLMGLWQVLRRAPHLKSELLLYENGNPNVRVVAQTYSGVFHSSHRRSRNEHLWKLASFPARFLRAFASGTAYSPGRVSLDLTGDSAAINRERVPSFSNRGLFLPLFLYVFWRAHQKLERRRYIDRWILMFSRTPSPQVPGEFIPVLPPPGRFWADPHVISRNGKEFVFFEDASLESGRGHISVLNLGSNSQPSKPTKVIERTYHLSYPFILEWEGDLFLIPESAESRTIDAYRCTNFPYEWQYDRTLINDVAAYDATLFKSEGYWWMFVNLPERTGASSWDELCLFYARTPLGSEWTPHPLNPVISDVRSARPAGPLWRDNGRIYRPSQDSSTRYGHKLNIMEVLELTTTSYREQLVEVIEPPPNTAIRAIHSYSRANAAVIIDAMYRERRKN